MNVIKISVMLLQLALGILFVYAGVQKFIPKHEHHAAHASDEGRAVDIDKTKSFIGGLKQSGYFWPFLGIVEIVGGLLLISQYFGLLGAVMLAPVSINIFLFHLFLESHEIGEMIVTFVYLLANFLIIAYRYRDLKSTFLKLKLT